MILIFHLRKKNDVLQLISQRDDNCGFYDCQIRFDLVPVAVEDERLQQVKQQQQQVHQKLVDFYHNKQAELQQIGIHDFIGEMHHQMPLAIKLPIQDSIQEQQSGLYLRWFDKILVDLENDDIRVFHAKSGNGDFIFVPTNKEQFTLSNWLSKNSPQPEAILYQDDHGAIYYNNYGQLEAFYSQYHEPERYYFFAIGKAADLPGIAQIYAVLRTINPVYQGKVLSATSASLSPQQFEQAFGLPLYDKQMMQENLIAKLEDALQFTELLKNRLFLNSMQLIDDSQFETKLVISSQPLKAAKQELIADMSKPLPNVEPYPVTYQDEHTLIFQSSYDSISYYFFEDNGLLYRISFRNRWDNDLSLINHLRFMNTLRSIEQPALNHYSAEILAQVRKYNEIYPVDTTKAKHYIVGLTDKDDDTYYGVIDQSGKMIIPVQYPEKPRLLADGYQVENYDIRKEKLGEGHYRIHRENERYGYYNLQGELQIALTESAITPVNGDLFILTKQVDSITYSGLFSTISKQWIYPQSYTDIDVVPQTDTVILATVKAGSMVKEENSVSYQSNYLLGNLTGELLFQQDNIVFMEYWSPLNAVIIAIEKEGTWQYGLMDLQGKIVVPTEYVGFHYANDGVSLYFEQDNLYYQVI